MPTWPEVLDAFERRIVEQRAMLDAGEAGTVAPFDPPTGLGSLPADQLGRASRLLHDSADLVAELRDNVTAIKQDLTVVRTVGASTGRAAGARFVDTSA